MRHSIDKKIENFNKGWENYDYPKFDNTALKIELENRKGNISNAIIDSVEIDASYLRIIKNKIKGEDLSIEFNHVLFTGKCLFYGNSDYPIYFNECIFSDDITFKTNFEMGVYFSLCKFQSELFLKDNHFNSVISNNRIIGFYTCFFEKGIKIKKSTFFNFCSFAFNHFYGDSFFEDVIFKSFLSFDYNTFYSDIEFRNVEFSSSVKFTENIFTKNMLERTFSFYFFSKLEKIFNNQGQIHEAYKYYALGNRSRQLNKLKVNLKKNDSLYNRFYSYIKHIFSLSTIYFQISDYGNSLFRPIATFTIITLTSSFMLLINSSAEICFEPSSSNCLVIESNLQNYGLYIIVALKGFLSPIYKFENYRPKMGFGFFLYILTTSIQFLSFALLAIAIRRKFKDSIL